MRYLNDDVETLAQKSLDLISQYRGISVKDENFALCNNNLMTNALFV